MDNHDQSVIAGWRCIDPSEEALRASHLRLLAAAVLAEAGAAGPPDCSILGIQPSLPEGLRLKR